MSSNWFRRLALGLVLFGSLATSSAEPYDDFDSSDRIDATLWGSQLEFAHEVTDGLLRFHQRRVEASSAASELRFADPSAIDAIAATVNVVRASDNDGAARARISGYFCDTDNTANEASNEILGDISIASFLGKRVVRAVLLLCQNARCGRAEGLVADVDTFSSPAFGTDHKLSLAFDRATNTFRFGFNDEQLIVGPEVAPVLANCAASNLSTKSIGTRVDGTNSSADIPDESGEIVATFDDVVVNGQPYDNFDSGRTPDPSLWASAGSGDQLVQIGVVDGNRKLQMETEHCGNADNYAETRLTMSNPSSINALSSDIVIISTDAEIAAGDTFSSRARVAGRFYRDGTPGGGRAGEVFLEMAMTQQFSDNPRRRANCFARKCVDARCRSAERIFAQSLGTWNERQTHKVFVGFDEVTKRLICGFDDKLHVHTIGTAMHPLVNPIKGLYTVVSGVEDGSCAALATDFDNVEVNSGLRDRVRFDVNPTDGLQTQEFPATSTQFFVKLSARPTADVVIRLTNTRSTEGFLDTNKLTFTPENWDTAVPVGVTGQDDSDDDGDWSYNIILGPTESADPEFDGKYLDHVEITNRDNEGPLAGLFVGYSDVTNDTTCENGDTNSVAVKLTRQPQGSGTVVSVTLSSDNETEGKIRLTDPLVFTFEDWNIPQFVDVVGQDDSNADGDQSYTVLAISESTDSAYDRKQAGARFTNLDNEGSSILCPAEEPLISNGFE